MKKTYTQWIQTVVQGIPALTSEPGDGFVGSLYGLLPDRIADAASNAVSAPWMTLDSQPGDALPLLASERRLERYPNETALNHKARLQAAWSWYEIAGTKQSLIDHLAAAGYVAEIWDTYTAEVPEFVEGSRSQFLVYFPDPAHHPLLAGAKPWGSFTWGDGTLWGCQLKPDDPYGLRTIRSIVKKRKPVLQLCRSLRFLMPDSSVIVVLM